MNVQKNSVQNLFPLWGEWEILLGGFFSLVTNSSLKLRINICILELSILFSEDLLFILHTSNSILNFLRKIDFSHIFHCPSFTLDMSLISWCIVYDKQFTFSQTYRKLLSQTNLIFWSFSLGSKLNFLVDFIKNKKCKKWLKYFATIKFCKKENKSYVKLKYCFKVAVMQIWKTVDFWKG